MNDGKKFEKQWKDSVPNTMYYFRIKDSASSFGKDSAKTRFTLNNPYDCFIFFCRYLFPLELKSTKGTSFSIQRSKIDSKSKMIKYSQIQGLLTASKYDGIVAGFVFDFRTSGNTYWCDINDFVAFLNSSTKKSINENDVINHNGILIQKDKQRTKYKLNILNLLMSIIEREDNNGKENSIQYNN